MKVRSIRFVFLGVLLIGLLFYKFGLLKLPSIEELKWEIYGYSYYAPSISLSDDEKKLWLGTLKGLFELDIKTGEIKNVAKDQFGSSPSIHSLLPDGKGGLWIGTEKGLAHTGSFNEGPMGGLINCLMGDNGKGIWFGTGGGLSYFGFKSGETIYYYEKNSALPNNSIQCLLKDGNGGLWIGMGRGIKKGNKETLAHLQSDGSWETFDLEKFGAPPHRSITSLEKDGDNGFWAGLGGFGEGGLAHFSTNKTWQFFTKNNSGLPNDRVTSLKSDGNGGVWVGTSGGLAHFGKNRAWKVYNEKNSRIPSKRVFDIEKDSDGNLWFSTASGYAHFFPLNIKNIPKLFSRFLVYQKNGRTRDRTRSTSVAQNGSNSDPQGTSGDNEPLMTYHTAKRLLAVKSILWREWDTPDSEWFAAERRFFSKQLIKDKYDLLIVPFQVQYDAVDQIGRALMTYRLAHEIESGTNLRVAPLNIVYRALGSHTRYYREEDVYALANRLGVSRVIWGYAGVKRSQLKPSPSLSLSLAIQTGPPFSDQSKLRHKNFKLTELTNTYLPFQAFSDNLKGVMTFFNLPDYVEVFPKTYSALPYPTLPTNPMDLTHLTTKNPIHRACYFQLLGLLTPESSEYTRNYFFIRSLISLSSTTPETPGYNLIAARAMLYLHRRPLALAILKSPAGIEEQALLELLNGNLTEFEQLSANIEPSLFKLFTEIELADLKYKYRVNINPNYDPILAPYPAWEYFLDQRLTYGDQRKLHSNFKIKELLDQDFPIPGYTLEDMAKGAIAARDVNKVAYHLELSFFDHINKVLEKDGAYYASLRHNIGPDRFDFLLMLSAIGEANLLKAVSYESYWRKDFDQATQMLDLFSKVFKDHPSFLKVKILTQYFSPSMSDAASKRTIEKQIHDNTLKALWWGGGYDGRSYFFSQLLWDDYMKRIKKENEDNDQYIFPASVFNSFRHDFPPRYVDARDNPVNKALLWSHDDFWMLYNRHKKIIESEPIKFAKQLTKKYQHRFHGHPYKTVMMADEDKREGKIEKAVQIYRQAIDNQPKIWSHYYELGKLYVSQSRYDEASDAFLSFPFFNPEEKYGYGDVALSNFAAYAGDELYWQGAYKQAKQLYEFSAQLNTGSQSGLTSHMRLSQMEHDFETAALYAIERAKRYNAPDAYAEYMTLLHLIDASDMAWALFNQRLGKELEPLIWTSALIGHRLENINIEKFHQWLKQISEMNKESKQRGFLARYGLLSLMDRKPDLNMVEVIDSVDDRSQFHVYDNLYVMNQLVDGKIGPGTLLPRDQQTENLKKSDSVTISYYTSFAEVYILLLQKSYKQAYRVLEQRSVYYDYKNHNYGKPLQSYLVWAGVKAGHVRKMAKFIDSIRKRVGVKDFDMELAQAAYKGGVGHHDAAIEHLKSAFLVIPKNGKRPQFPWYQMVELCEWLYEDSGHADYRDLALLWAQKHQVIQPMFAWGYGVEAKYTKNAEDKNRALAFAQYLDSQSAHIVGFSEQEKTAAAKWMEKHNPFGRKKSKLPKLSL